MREGLVTGGRAFVFLEDFDTEFTTKFRGGGYPPNISGMTIKPRWKNGGRTPTKNLIVKVACDSIDGELAADFTFPYADNALQTMIGPDATEWSNPVQISEFDANKALDKERNIYIWGRADYLDVFDPTSPRFTQFCYRIHFRRSEGHVRTQFIAYGDYNKSDQDR